MKPRIITTTRILAVAITSLSGCTSPTDSGRAIATDPSTTPTASSQPARTTDAASQAAATSATVPTTTAGASTLAGAPTATEAPNPGAGTPQAPLEPANGTPPTLPVVESPALITLRGELERTPSPEVMTKVAHFRPLCDDKGFPLVGNTVRKGGGYSPSSFCAVVRVKQIK